MPQVDFEREAQEFIDALLQSADPDRTALQGLSLIGKEGSDLIGHLVDAIDPQDRDVELPVLKRALVTVALRNVDRLDLRPLMKMGVNSAIPSLIPVAVDAAAEKGTVIAIYRDKYVVPGLDLVIQGAWTLRKSLAPDAPILVLE